MVKDTSAIYVWVNIIHSSYPLRTWSRHQESFRTPSFLSSWLASENLLELSFDKETTNHLHGWVSMKLCLVPRHSLVGRNWDCDRKSTKSDKPNLIISPTRILLYNHKQVIVLWFKKFPYNYKALLYNYWKCWPYILLIHFFILITSHTFIKWILIIAIHNYFLSTPPSASHDTNHLLFYISFYFCL